MYKGSTAICSEAKGQQSCLVVQSLPPLQTGWYLQISTTVVILIKDYLILLELVINRKNIKHLSMKKVSTTIEMGSPKSCRSA